MQAQGNRPSATPLCDLLKSLDEWNPNWEPFYELDPAWTEKFMAMALTPMLSCGLDANTIDIITIAAASA